MSEDRRPRSIGRMIGLAIGLALLLGALVVIVRQREHIGAALEHVREPSPVLIAVLVGSVAANLVLSALTFSVLMSRYGRVGIVEMQALICTTALVNFLPFRPGLVGRIAYHRAVNDIAVFDSTKVLIQGALLTGLAAAALAVAALIAHHTGARLDVLIVGSLALGTLCWIASRTIASLTPDEQQRRQRRATVRLFAVAAFVRYVEVLIWAVRYLAAFALIGSSIDPVTAIGFGCVSILATMVPFFSNGLGLREWLIGLLAPILAGYRLELGLAAELVNRAMEIAVVAAMGSLGMFWLSRRVQRGPSHADPDAA